MSPAKRHADWPARASSTIRRLGSDYSRATTTSRRKLAPAASTETRVGTRRSPRSRWRTSSTDSMPRTRVETRARARVLQALYAWDLRGEQGLERVASQIWDDLSVSPEERKIAGLLVRTVAQHGEELDAELTEVTTNWRLDRLGVVERSVLRMGAAELLGGKTPPRVVIQVGVKLAERYGSVQSAKFVNGVLDAFARRMGRI